MLILANNLKANVQDATRPGTGEPQRAPEPAQHLPRRRGRSPRPFSHTSHPLVVADAVLQTQADSKTALARLKGPKFFLQFQIARVRTAQGAKLSAAETVEHQLGKVTKVRLLRRVEEGLTQRRCRTLGVRAPTRLRRSTDWQLSFEYGHGLWVWDFLCYCLLKDCAFAWRWNVSRQRLENCLSIKA